MATLRKQDQVLATLRERILSGRYGTGDPLKERSLAEELGVSRLPVREALSKLNASGLVEIFPNRGAEVRRLSAANIESLYQLREAIEGMAARLAAVRMPTGALEQFKERYEQVVATKDAAEGRVQSSLGDEFHAKIIDESRNSMIIEFGNSTADLIQYARHLSYLEITPELSIESAKQHLSIIDAVDCKNPDLAEENMRKHISYWAKTVLKNMMGDVSKTGLYYA